MSAPPPLVALSPGTLERDASRSTVRVLAAADRAFAAAIDGGVSAFLVREYALEDGAFLELLGRLRERLRAAEVAGGPRGWLGVHDRLHLAAACEADAGYIGGRSLPLEEARKVLGERTLGVSTHPGDAAPSADFCFHARAFPPTSKPDGGQGHLGWDGIAGFAASTEVPVYALGGITVDRLRELSNADGPAGALAGAAMIGGLWGPSLGDLGGIQRRASELAAEAHRVFRSRIEG